MIHYLFTSVDPPYKASFEYQTRHQNQKVAQILAISIFLFSISLSLTDLLIDYETVLRQYASYQAVNIYFVASSGVFSLLFLALAQTQNALSRRVKHVLVWLFSMSIVSGCIWISFIAQANPKNTLTLLMLSLIAVASVMVLSLAETLLIAFVSFITFTIGLGYYQTDLDLWISNYIGFCLVLIGYFVLSRLVYSFHANYHIKVNQIEDQNKAIEASNQSKNEILSLVAHDLRSPVGNIAQLVKLMETGKLTDAEMETCRRHIQESCIKADSIIREILVVAQDDSNQELLRTKETNLNQLLSQTVKTWEQVVNGTRNIRLVVPDAPLYVPINHDKFQRVLDNLMNNAIKFTAVSTGVITIELQSIAKAVRITISDNGIGIPARMLPHVFDKFTSAGRTGLLQEPSIGLGLHISKQLVEKHGGRIWVESEEYKGSVFYIDLPTQ